MAKIVIKQMKARGEDNEQVITETVRLENQITLLHTRIRELEDQLLYLREEEAPYKHNADDLPSCISRSEEQMGELEDIIKWWSYKTNLRSEVFEKIENAPLRLRDKLVMMFIFTALCPPNRGSGGGGGPAAGIHELLRGMFGG